MISYVCMKPNPHLDILQSLYDLYNENIDNDDALSHVQTIAWALGQKLDFDYAYFELAELIMTYRHDPNMDSQYYKARIDRQLRIFKEEQK